MTSRRPTRSTPTARTLSTSRPPGPTLLLAQVKAVTADSLFLRLEDGNSEPATRASGCLLEPREGDQVLCVAVGDAISVLNILSRPHGGEAALSVPGADSLALVQTALAVHADQVEVDSATITVRSASARFLGKAASVIADSLETVVNNLRRVAQQDISSAVDSVRVVENTDTLKARHLTHEAGQTMALRSHITVIDATSDVRVNGERISLG